MLLLLLSLLPGLGGALTRFLLLRNVTAIALALAPLAARFIAGWRCSGGYHHLAVCVITGIPQDWACLSTTYNASSPTRNPRGGCCRAVHYILPDVVYALVQPRRDKASNCHMLLSYQDAHFACCQYRRRRPTNFVLVTRH